MRLTVKLPAIVVGAMLLTAVASGLVSVAISRNVLRQAALDETVHRVEMYSSAVRFYVDSARSLLTTTAELPLMRSLARPRELAALVLAHSEVFEYVTLLTPDGTVAMQEPRALEERLSHRDLSFNAWFGEVRKTGRTVVSDLHISPATQRPTIVIAAPVRAADGRTVGILAGALKLGELSEIGSVASGRSAPSGSGYVTDRRGLIIAHQTRPSYVEQQTDFSTVPSVSAALAGEQGSSESFNPIDGEQELSAYRPLPDLGWAVAYGVPTATALAPLDALTRGILSASVVLAALIGVGVFILARRTVAPLARLAAAAQTVGTGDFSRRIEATDGDEIGQLAEEFNRMAGALSEKDAEVRRRAAELESSNRELEAFSYSVSHDLRAPLRAMDGFSLALLEDCGDKLDEEGKDTLGRIRAASQRMGTLIDDLLGLSRVNRAVLNHKRIEISAIAREIADALQQGQPGRAVKWEIEEGLALRADRALIEIALRNLIENAWKFTGKTARPVIRVGALEREGGKAYFVADNGAGFDMAYSESLFGAFQRLHHADEFPGTGIGLAIVHRIIRRHDGEIWAQAKPGEGAAFFFTVGKPGEEIHG
jgi:signal transduction histidine kinase